MMLKYILLLVFLVFSCGKPYVTQEDELLPDSTFTYCPKQLCISGEELILPKFNGDNVPIYERSKPWIGFRSYVTKTGSIELTEAAAFDFYLSLIVNRLHPLNLPYYSTPSSVVLQGRLFVIGIRGMYPGEFIRNENTPDQFNDTIVLLYYDAKLNKKVFEFPASVDVGHWNWNSSSASYLLDTPNVTLKSNKADKKYFYYYYGRGLHRGSYHALIMNMYDYRVRAYENDQMGYIRTGGGHNIHAARDVGTHDFHDKEATVANNSAGCQVIYGQENYYIFVKNAYNLIDQKITKYFLFDGLDIEAMVSNNLINPPEEFRLNWKKEWDEISSLPYYIP